MKKLKQSEEIQRISQLIRLFVIVYGGKKEDSLNTLRYAKFMEMIVSTKMLDPINSLLLQEQHTITAYVSTYKLLFGRSLLSIPSTQHCGGGI